MKLFLIITAAALLLCFAIVADAVEDYPVLEEGLKMIFDETYDATFDKSMDANVRLDQLNFRNGQIFRWIDTDRDQNVTKEEYNVFLGKITHYFLRQLLLAIPYGVRHQVQENFIKSVESVVDDSIAKFDAYEDGKLTYQEYNMAMRD